MFRYILNEHQDIAGDLVSDSLEYLKDAPARETILKEDVLWLKNLIQRERQGYFQPRQP